MRVHRALWFSGRARRVNDHHRVLGRRALGRRVIKTSWQSRRRSRIAPEVFDEPFARLVQDDQMPQCWSLGGGFIGDWFHRQKFSAGVRSSGRKERFCLASLNRDTIAAAPNPEKSGRKIPPILMMASIATTISGTIGMNTPMASPLPRPRLRRE